MRVKCLSASALKKHIKDIEKKIERRHRLNPRSVNRTAQLSETQKELAIA